MWRVRETQIFRFTSLQPETGALIWGIGPSFTVPTSSEHALGQGKYCAGLSGVVLTIQGPWLVGILISDVASVGGERDRGSVDQLVMQPFANYNLPRGWNLTSSPIVATDLKRASTDRWTVPIGVGAGKVFRVGKHAINASLKGFSDVVQARQLDASSATSVLLSQMIFGHHTPASR